MNTYTFFRTNSVLIVGHVSPQQLALVCSAMSDVLMQVTR